ncbi:acetyltransferase (GNAT) family protein [Fontibacillus phaseoli]|uniref:Acetyltransferase (GNAT) family protein n=1 Tax=Fontibacillus phaseoli TaxID=1416533 RepID=A0A369BHG0_9BACL|nr:GNAT family N-acetyltransferase [Fontibacillus phaseoli]RCX20705.1 acetyltransferase (GNAT) family protein [Fontibacillus phaseoli]
MNPNHKMIEELALNNWPALSTLLYDGWVLRFAKGCTKRANSVSPLFGSSLDLEQKILECENIYAANQLPAIFKITPFIHPADLDNVLEQKGYQLIDVTSMQTMHLNNLAEPRLHTVKIVEHVDEEWLEQFGRLDQASDRKLDTMREMLSNIKTPKGFILLYHDGQVVACGLGVIERGYIGLYDIVTDAARRNQGLGEQMILHLLKWGKANGARDSYLAVVANNDPALRLYSKIGFTEAYRHWYRVQGIVKG